jgi:hypothetical protein
MGASNALAAYVRWAGKVPPMSMQVLLYMALVSKDSDVWPWFGLGQAALAEHAMGRVEPTATDVRAVSRAMSPLLDAGAVTVTRAASHRSGGNSTAKYHLNLHERADAARSEWEQSPDGKRRMADPRRKGVPQDGNRRMEATGHTTESDNVIRRNPTSHTTVCDEPYDELRRSKEEEETRGAREGRNGDLPTASHPPRVAVPGDASVIPLFASQSPDARRRARSRLEGAAALAAKAERARERIAETEARVRAQQEAK